MKHIGKQSGFYWNAIPNFSKRNKRTKFIIGNRRRQDTGTCECLICGNKLMSLSSHLIHVHDITPTEYRTKYMNASVTSAELKTVMHQISLETADKKLKKTAPLMTCVHCGKNFQRQRVLHNHKPAGFDKVLFCSDKCRNTSMRKGVPIICVTCKKEFYAPPSRKSKYCSLKCRPNKKKKEREFISCHLCGKSFMATLQQSNNYKNKKPVVCSIKCRQSLNGSKRKA